MLCLTSRISSAGRGSRSHRTPVLPCAFVSCPWGHCPLRGTERGSPVELRPAVWAAAWEGEQVGTPATPEPGPGKDWAGEPRAAHAGRGDAVSVPRAPGSAASAQSGASAALDGAGRERGSWPVAPGGSPGEGSVEQVPGEPGRFLGTTQVLSGSGVERPGQPSWGMMASRDLWPWSRCHPQL